MKQEVLEQLIARLRTLNDKIEIFNTYYDSPKLDDKRFTRLMGDDDLGINWLMEAETEHFDDEGERFVLFRGLPFRQGDAEQYACQLESDFETYLDDYYDSEEIVLESLAETIDLGTDSSLMYDEEGEDDGNAFWG